MKRINLIPRDSEQIFNKRWIKYQLRKNRFLQSSIVIVFILLLFNIWQATSIIRYKTLISFGNKKMASAQAKLNKSSLVLISIEKEKAVIDGQLEIHEKKLDVLNHAQRDKYRWAKLMKKLTEIVPNDLWLNKVVLNDRPITINGKSSDNSVVSSFMEALDESGYFQETNFNYTEKTEFSDIAVTSFEVTSKAVLSKLIKE